MLGSSSASCFSAAFWSSDTRSSVSLPPCGWMSVDIQGVRVLECNRKTVRGYRDSVVKSFCRAAGYGYSGATAGSTPRRGRATVAGAANGQERVKREEGVV